MTPNVLIALTAYGGWTRNACVASVVGLVQAIAARGWECNFSLCDQNDVAQARNSMASLMLAHRQYSHLLFVDYDMAFQPQPALRLIASDLPVVGVAAVVRTHADRRGPLTAKDFNVTLKPITPERDGIAEVAAVGMALTAIKRETLEAMHSTGQLPVRPVHGFKVPQYPEGPLFGFFDRLTIDGELFGEDYSFCHRWHALCGGASFAVIDDPIIHMKDAALSGRLSTVLQDSQIGANSRRGDSDA